MYYTFLQAGSPTKLSTDAVTAVSHGADTVPSTTVMPEHAASEPQAQKTMIALEIVFFYLHEASEATRGWSRVLRHAGQVLVLWLALTQHQQVHQSA